MDPVAAAKAFVKDTLSVEFFQDKSDLLNKIVRAFFEKVPFQNISTSILPPEQRFPTEQVIIENGISLKGGLNIHNNCFLKMLLEALSYKVHLVAASVVHPPKSKAPRRFGNHCAILVRDLEKPGDLHLVDVGSGYPVFKAVPLDRLPYTATDVTLTYRFVEECGQWHREHKDAYSETWTRFVTYDKEAVQASPAEVFKGPVEELFQEDWLVAGVTAIRYPQPGSSAIPDVPDFGRDYDYVLRIVNDKITFGNSSGYTWEEPVPLDQLVSVFQTYFPTVPKDQVQRKVQILSEEAAGCKY
ncbi:uncharacterized protein LOC107224838 [Neodiprion lecontei]|uniref:arylamine N-acetyltransferase n=1 Tax=Neodiprion lecontei TaxID=441921 RepID=A0A6J0BZV1_NEOLC|nr:uncharacterized protein LOC107224838 [Neodiprion lecontei]